MTTVRLWLLSLVLLTPPALLSAEPLLQETFESAPSGSGWVYESRRPIDASGFHGREDGTAYLVTPVSRDFAGWVSPAFDVTPGEHYRIRLRYRCADRAYCGAVFRDANDAPLPADHYSGLDASEGWTTLEICFRAKARAVKGLVSFRTAGQAPLHVDDVQVERVAPAAAIAWADALYATLPPLNYQPPADRWALIPNAIAALRARKPLRIVMLGDSIVNDTGNSLLPALLAQAWDNPQLNVITSVRGGTGCDFYRQKGRIQEYVLDYQPDLVIIGGVCNRRAEYVREVVRQLREAKPGIEIALMSGPYGWDYKPPTAPDWTPAVDPNGRDYRSQLARVALEEKCEFLDVQGAADQYFRECGRDVQTYMRDSTHPNDRGRQIIGRIVLRYLSPNPEATP